MYHEVHVKKISTEAERAYPFLHPAVRNGRNKALAWSREA